jgi:hypothetical protein
MRSQDGSREFAGWPRSVFVLTARARSESARSMRAVRRSLAVPRLEEQETERSFSEAGRRGHPLLPVTSRQKGEKMRSKYWWCLS